MHYLRFSAGLAALLSVSHLVSRPGPLAGQDKQSARSVWQYKVLDAISLQDYKGAKSLEEGLNKLGAEGWNLVAVEPGIPRPGSVSAHEKDATKPVTFASRPM